MVPDPVPAVVEVKAAGSVLLQIVCAADTAPAVTASCTVIASAAVGADSHRIPFSEEMVTLLNQVVALSAAGV
ncbi:hypothetical protein D3C71_2161330 [compost metagenome]